MGACIGKDGKVYFIPHDNTKTRSILVLDPANDTTEVFGNISDASYTSAVLAEDGCIYAMPADEKNAVLKIDTSTKVLTKLYPESGKFSAGYAGCSIGPDGRIVAVCNYLLDAPKPYLAVIDVKNQKVFEYDTHIDGLKLWSLVLAPQGYMYGVGEPFDSIYRINPTGDCTPMACPWAVSTIVNKF